MVCLRYRLPAGEGKKMNTNSVVSIEQIEELFAQRKSGRISRDHLQRLLENPDSFNPNVSRWARSFWSVEADYDQGLEAMIKAGRYDRKNDDITPKNFPLKYQGKRVVPNLELAQFDEMIKGTEAVKQLESLGYECADIGLLLAFGAAYPNEQRRRPIVALASQWRDSDGRVRVPCLDSDGSDRRLSLRWLESDFYPRCQFLVSHK
jgi:hypothetical protein